MQQESPCVPACSVLRLCACPGGLFLCDLCVGFQGLVTQPQSIVKGREFQGWPRGSPSGVLVWPGPGASAYLEQLSAKRPQEAYSLTGGGGNSVVT